MTRNTNGDNVKQKFSFISLMVMIMSRAFATFYAIKGLGIGELATTNSVINGITSFCLLGIPFSISIYTAPVCNFTILALLVTHLGLAAISIIPVFYLILATILLAFFSTAVFAIPFSSKLFMARRTRFNSTALLTNGPPAVLAARLLMKAIKRFDLFTVSTDFHSNSILL